MTGTNPSKIEEKKQSAHTDPRLWIYSSTLILQEIYMLTSDNLADNLLGSYVKILLYN